jgi:hypothetical protein
VLLIGGRLGEHGLVERMHGVGSHWVWMEAARTTSREVRRPRAAVMVLPATRTNLEREQGGAIGHACDRRKPAVRVREDRHQALLTSFKVRLSRARYQ